ncbi:Uncharacterised protein [Mycobacteroides abscessus subsp. abscessus]|uniref:beta family protein n=1 Tax=Mycobacteroides abscessus TaxID=36809 RepID=UPI00092C583B|nr:beta family protein [Mycobacteroides abscessus]SHT89571.1 Uncharacterised protein [Mycobacteroides abscessus subsp. abscessus]SLL32992.1 Uncharacterised protein [Mycobacteroides abscessus subsp. abscessus]
MVTENTPLTATDYVPILKSKMSELGAAESCTTPGVVPLFEIVSPKDAVASMQRVWPSSKGVVWLHSLNLEGREELAFAAAVEQMFTELREPVLAVPVVTPDEDSSLMSAVRGVVATDRRGLVLRIDVSDLIDPETNTAEHILATLDDYEVTESVVDLVLDAGLIRNQTPVTAAAIVDQALLALPNAKDWRSLVVALSAFPQAVYEVVPRSSVGEIPRNDAAAFAAIQSPYQGRVITFGDYTIGTPAYGDVRFAPVPSIKYTTDKSWMVHRAAQKRGPGPQYRQLAADVASAEYFAGRDFSYGDRYIDDVANELDGPGSAMTYLRAGISHHVRTVTNRLATHGVP